MITAYIILLMVLTVSFGVMAIGLPDDKATVRSSCAKLTGLCLVSLLAIIWMM